MWMVLFIYCLYILTVYVLKWYPLMWEPSALDLLFFFYLLLAFFGIGFQPNTSSSVLPGQADYIELPDNTFCQASTPGLHPGQVSSIKILAALQLNMGRYILQKNEINLTF